VRAARSAIADLSLLLDPLGLCEAAAYLSMAADRLELAASDLRAKEGAVRDQGDLASMEARRQLEGPKPRSDGEAWIMGSRNQAFEPGD
jgi:hypothetical protein